jgi:chromosome segregation ATPase
MANENRLTLEGVADDLDTVKSIMFTLARQYERIDRTVDRIVLQQENNNRDISELSQFMKQLAETTARSQTDMLTMTSEIREMQSEIREMQSEIRGLQVENRRILQRVFGDEF